MKKKILVTGANGLLGQTLIGQLLVNDYYVIATGKGPQRFQHAAAQNISYHDVDITDGPAIEKVIVDSAPDVIVHAAAMTQVDQCELHKQECYNINVTATRFIIDAAKAVNSRILFVSTDFIFDGNEGPYKEDAEPAPVNYYGSTKLVAEKAVMESGLPWAIARTILVYGSVPSTGRTNILGFVKNSLENNTPIKMVTDQVRTPTFVDDLARAIVLMIEKNATGIYHISGDEQMTPYEVAMSTARFLNLDEKLISTAVSDDIKQPAMRPPKTGFDISKAKKDLGYKPTPFRDGLKSVFGK